jgi:hypothetical protein
MKIIKEYKKINIEGILKEIWKIINSMNNDISIENLEPLDLLIRQLARIEVYDSYIHKLSEKIKTFDSYSSKYSIDKINKILSTITKKSTEKNESQTKNQITEQPIIYPFIYALQNLQATLTKSKNVLEIKEYKPIFQQLEEIFCPIDNKLCNSLKEFSVTDKPSTLRT